MQARAIDYFNQGTQYGERSDYENALICFSQAIALDDKYESAYLARGYILYQQRKYEDAIKDFKALLNLDAENVPGRMYLAHVFAAQKKNALAITHYSRVVKLWEVKKTSDDIAVAALANRAVLYNEEGDQKEASASLQLATSINPHHSAITQVYADMNFKNGKVDEAIANHAAVIEACLYNEYALYPSVVTTVQVRNAYKSRAALYMYVGSLNEAIQDYTSLLELNPNGLDVYYHRRGLCYWHQGNLPKALEDFKKAALPRAQLSMIYVTYMLDEHRSLPRFDDVSMPLAYLYRAIACEREGNIRQAINDYKVTCKSYEFTTWQNLYSTLRLKKLNVDVKLDREYVNHVANAVIKHADNLVTVVLACQSSRLYDQAKLILGRLMSSFLPHAISPILQPEFIQVLTNSNCWPKQEAVQLKNEWVKQYKDQLLSIIKCLDDPRLLLNAGLQSLCHQTLLGRVFYLSRDTISSATITSGRLGALAEFLNQRASTMHNIAISPSTKDALANEFLLTPDFKKIIKQKYPGLYSLIKPYIAVKATFKLFDHIEKSVPIQGRDEGNHFINNFHL